MKPYLEQIKDLIKEPYEKKDERFDSVQDLLWYYYTMHHPADTDTLREKMIELEPIIRPLSEKRKKHLRYRIFELRIEHERTAFLSGMQVGALLIQELQKSENQKIGK